MTAKTLAVAACAAAVTALSFAGPALANPPFSGKYDIDGASDEFYWTVTPTCATEGCTARVVSNRGWSSMATLINGRWNFTVTKPDSVVCSDGTFAPIFIHYMIDPATLNGVVTADSNGSCPGGQDVETTIKLNKLG